MPVRERPPSDGRRQQEGRRVAEREAAAVAGAGDDVDAAVVGQLLVGHLAEEAVEAYPGETVTVRIPLPERTWQIWDDGWHTVPGRYAVTAARALDNPALTAEVNI